MATTGKWKWDDKTQTVVPYDKPKASEVHSVIGDEIAPLMHPITGKFITSKAKFRQETRNYGATEMGNEPMQDPDRRKYIDAGIRKNKVIEALKLEKEHAYRERLRKHKLTREYRAPVQYTDD